MVYKTVTNDIVYVVQVSFLCQFGDHIFYTCICDRLPTFTSERFASLFVQLISFSHFKSLIIQGKFCLVLDILDGTVESMMVWREFLMVSQFWLTLFLSGLKSINICENSSTFCFRAVSAFWNLYFFLGGLCCILGFMLR